MAIEKVKSDVEHLGKQFMLHEQRDFMEHKSLDDKLETMVESIIVLSEGQKDIKEDIREIKLETKDNTTFKTKILGIAVALPFLLGGVTWLIATF